MRICPGRLLRAASLCLSFALVPIRVSAAEVHPVESELRRSFPGVAIESAATFESADAFVAGRLTSGLRARFSSDPKPDGRAAVAAPQPLLRTESAPEAALSVLYPRSYDGPIVAELGSVRVVLRAVGAAQASASESNGKLVYTRPYASTDVIEVPKGGRSEELLLLRDDQAPAVFEYEIVATEGVSAVMISDGAVRFLPKSDETPTATSPAAHHFTRPTPLLQIDKPWLVDSWGKRNDTQAHWTLVGDGAIPKAVRLTVEPGKLVFPVVVDPSFSATGSLLLARRGHVATLLPNGKVLITGGYSNTYQWLATSELWDPATGTSTLTGALNTARIGHTATVLTSGKVLIAGGNAQSTFDSAELYDPATGVFTVTGSMNTARSGHTATLLPNGVVFLAEGVNSSLYSSASGELYDATKGTFTATKGTDVARQGSTATLLPDGTVLIAGGYSSGHALSSAVIYDPAADTFTATTGNLVAARFTHFATLLTSGLVLIAGGSASLSAELYNYKNGTFTATGSMSTAHGGGSATLLPNGRVQIVGGWDSGTRLNTSEIFNPSSGTNGAFAAGETLLTARADHSAVLLPNGRIMIAGGWGGTSNYQGLSDLQSVELSYPASGSFTAAASLTTGRSNHTVTQLPNGKVLIAGGYNGGFVSSNELYDSATNTCAAAASLATARGGHTATLLTNGKVLIAGGNTTGSNLASTELYDWSTNTISSGSNMSTARQDHTATLLADGRVLVAAGYGSSYLNSAEVYDPANGLFATTGNLVGVRGGHTATLLQNGKVLITGGFNGTSYLASAELYDPVTNTFAATGNMGTPRIYHTATLLPNGKVLIAGGANGGTRLNTAELYDPTAGTFSATGSMANPRDNAAAVLLSNGRVLIAGGYNGSAYLTAAEIYDPFVGTFTTTASLGTARMLAEATLLPTGKVLVAGGYNGSYLNAADLYDIGNGFSDSRRPVINTAPQTWTLPATLTLTGTGFLGDSEASSGGNTSSATNYPVMQLQRIDDGQIAFASSAQFSDTAWAGSTSSLPTGPYRATVFTNAIPSLQKIIRVSGLTIASVSPASGNASGGQTITISGTNLSGVTVTIGGNSAVVTQTNNTTARFTTPAHAPGIVNVTVTRTDGMTATSIGAFTYVADVPTNVVARAQTPTSVQVTWTPAPGATSYVLYRQASVGAIVSLGTTSATTFTDSSVTANAAYMYAVAQAAPYTSSLSTWDLATTVIFTDDPLVAGTTPVRAAHFTELRTAVNAMERFALYDTWTAFTDPVITPGTAVVKAVHLTELRNALDAVRAALLLPAITYTNPAPTAGASTISAADITDLRNGVK